MRIRSLIIGFYFFMAAVNGQSMLNPYMPVATAGFAFGGRIPGSQDSIPNIVYNPAGMIEITRPLLFINGQVSRDVVSNKESNSPSHNETICYQGSFTIGVPISLWQKRLFLAGIVDWHIHPDQELLEFRYYYENMENDLSKVSIARIGLGAGYELSDIFNLGISVNRWLGSAIQKNSIIYGTGPIAEIEYYYSGTHITVELKTHIKKITTAFLWQSPVTLLKANEVFGASTRNVKYTFTGAGGLGLIYRIGNPLSIGLGYWRQISGKMRDESVSQRNINGIQNLTAGTEYALKMRTIPVRIFLAFVRSWLPDIIPVSYRSQHQLLFGISGQYQQLGIHSSIKWQRDMYHQFDPISLAS
jgi:hypothetical protein